VLKVRTRTPAAEAAAIALTDEGRLDGITPALTGPQALDFAAIAAIASQLTPLPPA
jgi:NAD(P)H dehydrogenase (quinone)